MIPLLQTLIRLRQDTTDLYISGAYESLAIDTLKAQDSILSSNKLEGRSNSDFMFSEKQETSHSSILETGYNGVRHIFSLEHTDGIFILLLMCFVFCMRIYRDGITFLKENIRFIFYPPKYRTLFGETTITDFWTNFLLIFQVILLSSIVLFVFIMEYEGYPVYTHDYFITILLFVLCIGLTEGFKFLFYKFTGYLFHIGKAVKVWYRSYLAVLEMVGLIAFVPVLLLVYSDYFHDLLLGFFVVLFVVSRLIIFYRIVIFFLRENVNLLYLITYLCTIEIIPYILLYQGLIYLYKIDVINLLWLK